MIYTDKQKLADFLAKSGSKLIKLNSNGATILLNSQRIKIINGDFARMIEDIAIKGVES